MDAATMRRRVEAARVGHLASVSPGGRPHVVPCCFVLYGAVIYSAVDAKPKSTAVLQRIRNLDGDPAAALLVDHYSEDWSMLWWVRVDGDARLPEPGAEWGHAFELLADKYEQYRAEPPPGPLVAIDITSWRAWP